MRSLALGLLLVLTCTGWSCAPVRPSAPVAAPPAMCRIPCTPSPTDTGVRWRADPADPAAFDALGGDVVPLLAGKLLTCEQRRQACAGFIDDLAHRGVYRER